MEERFSSVEEMDVINPRSGFVDDLPKQIQVHEPLVLFFEVLVGAHDTPEVADARRFHPEADGHIIEPGLVSLVA
jgi:hypothetical protein